MSRDCRTFGQFPRQGGWHNQSDYEMEAMRVAQAAERVYAKQQNGVEWTLADAEFVAWVEGDES